MSDGNGIERRIADLNRRLEEIGAELEMFALTNPKLMHGQFLLT